MYLSETEYTDILLNLFRKKKKTIYAEASLAVPEVAVIVPSFLASPGSKTQRVLSTERLQPQQENGIRLPLPKTSAVLFALTRNVKISFPAICAFSP